jgi:hypothetical protein
MTATHVNGIQVTGTETAFTPVGKEHRRVVWLVLADGTKTAGCTTDGCEYAAPSPQAVTRHSKVVHDGWIPQATVKRQKAEEATAFLSQHPAIVRYADISLADLLEHIEDEVDDLDILHQRLARKDEEIGRKDELIGKLKTEVKDLKAKLAQFRKAFSAFAELGQEGGK